MTDLTRQQLIQYAQTAGFSGNSLNTIVAIALAESSGNTLAVNSADPYGGSFGVLQINGSHIVPYGSLDMSCAYDPQCSFNYAYQLSSNGTDFTPWGSYTDQRYLQYLQGSPTTSTSTVTGGNTLSTNVPTALPDIGTAIRDIGSVAGAIKDWATNPIRVLKLVFGITFIMIPIILLVSPEAEKTAEKVAPLAEAA